MADTAAKTTAVRGILRTSTSSGRGRASTSSGREARGSVQNVHKKSVGSTGDATNDDKTGQDENKTSIASGGGSAPDDKGLIISGDETVKEGLDFYMVENVQIHKDQNILQDQKSVKPLSVFSRRVVFAVKVWTLLFLYTACTGVLIGVYSYVASLPKSRHTYGIVAVLEVLDRRLKFGKQCGRSPTRQAQPGGSNDLDSGRACNYDLPHSPFLLVTFCINIFTILFLFCMIAFRRYPVVYRHTLVIYAWVILVEWKLPAGVNIGALALVWIKFRDQYYSLTDIMFRDMESAAKLMSYNPFWTNTQLQDECCGVYGRYSSAEEWAELTPTMEYPLSCCPPKTGMPSKCLRNETWDIGCRDRQVAVLSIIGGQSLGLLVFIIIFSWNLMRIMSNHGESWGMNLLHWGLSRAPSHTASSVMLKLMKISTSGQIIIEGWSDRSMKIVVINYKQGFKFTTQRKLDFLQFVCRDPGKKGVIGYVQVEMLMTAPSRHNLANVMFDSNDTGIITITFDKI